MSEVMINGINIYYEEKGDPGSDTALFFLNGVMASTGSWDLMLPVFEKAGFRIILHDFRAQLKSGKPEQTPKFDEHVEDLRGLMNHLGISRASFIGTSYGGEVFMYFAVKYPQMCSSGVIIDSVSELSPLLEAAVGSWLTAAELGNGEAFYNIMLPWLYSSSYLKNNHDFLMQRGCQMNSLPSEYFSGQADLYRTFLTVDITSKLHGITAPVLVLCGKEDILKPPYFSEIIADSIPSGELILIPDCGHVAIFEKAHELNELIMGFYERKRLIPS